MHAALRRLMVPAAALAALLPGTRGAAQAPAPPPAVIDGAALQEDVALLRRAFETLHPGLHRYHTPAEMAARFDALHADVGRGMTTEAAYLRLAAFLDGVRCGHTYPNFFNQNADVTARVVTSARRLPLHLRWLGGRMVVTRALGGAPLEAGTEVTAVDGVPADSLLRLLLPLSRADGGNDAKRVANLEVHGRAEHEAFDVYAGHLLALGDSATLRVRGPRGLPPRDVRVATMTFAERDAIRRAEASAAGTGWTLEHRADGAAVMRMPSWVAYDRAWDWRAWVDSAFDALAARGTPLLVIDLRGNEGGSAVGDAILARLTDRPLPPSPFERWVRYRTLPPELRPHLATWDRSFDDWSAQVGEARGGFLRLGSAAAPIAPRGPRFAGRVAVLVDASNSSATFHFAAAVRRHGLGTLVGSPTGGNQRGTNGGAFYFLRLPRSGIEVDLPLIGYFPPGLATDGVSDAGLLPDVAVEPGPDDIAAGTDPVLEAALRLQAGGARR